MILRKTVDQNDPPQEDPKQSFYGRAKRITGRPLTGIEDVRGLDYAKLMNMSDEEMVGLLNLVNRVAPEEQGDVQGGIGRAMDNFSDIKEQATILKDEYGVDFSELLPSIFEIRETPWYKREPIELAAKASGLYR